MSYLVMVSEVVYGSAGLAFPACPLPRCLACLSALVARERGQPDGDSLRACLACGTLTCTDRGLGFLPPIRLPTPYLNLVSTCCPPSHEILPFIFYQLMIVLSASFYHWSMVHLSIFFVSLESFTL